MGENNPPHRKSMEDVTKFAILDSARLLQALQSVRTIEVPLRYGAIHRKNKRSGRLVQIMHDGSRFRTCFAGAHSTAPTS
jgi:hypothetical protein